MWSNHKRLSVAYGGHVAFLGLFLLCAAGCDMFQRDNELPPPSSESSPTSWEMPASGLEYRIPRIDVTMSSGWGEYDNVTVMPGGLFIKRLHYDLPELSRQLSDDDYGHLISLFSGFLGFGPEYGTGCADGRYYTISITNVYYEKSVLVGCAIDILSDSVSVQLTKLVQEIDRLSLITYNQLAPWIGLTNSVSIDRSSYTRSDTLRVNYLINNPTGSNRSIYFRYEDRVSLSIYSGRLIYRTPTGSIACPSIEGLPCNPDKITIVPGESVMIKSNLAVSRFEVSDPASTVSYRLKVWLRHVYFLFPEEEFTFLVTP